MVVERLPTRQLDVVFRTDGPPDGVRSQSLIRRSCVIRIDGHSPTTSQLDPFQTPLSGVGLSTRADRRWRQPLIPSKPRAAASLGIVFVMSCCSV